MGADGGLFGGNTDYGGYTGGFSPAGSFADSEAYANNAQSNNFGLATGYGNDGYQDIGYANDFSGLAPQPYSMVGSIFDDFIGLPVDTFSGGYSYGSSLGRGMENKSFTPAEAFSMINDQDYGLMGKLGALYGGQSGSISGRLKAGMSVVPGMTTASNIGMGLNSVLSALSGQNPFGGEPDPKVEGGPPTPLKPIEETAKGLMTDVSKTPTQTKQKLNIEPDFNVDNIMNSADPYLQALDFLRLSGVL